jgi:hypothetical protein
MKQYVTLKLSEYVKACEAVRYEEQSIYARRGVEAANVGGAGGGGKRFKTVKVSEGREATESTRSV